MQSSTVSGRLGPPGGTWQQKLCEPGHPAWPHGSVDVIDREAAQAWEMAGRTT